MSEDKKRIIDSFIFILLVITLGAGIILVIYVYEKSSKLAKTETAKKPVPSAQGANEEQPFFSDETEHFPLLTGEAQTEFEQPLASPRVYTQSPDDQDTPADATDVRELEPQMSTPRQSEPQSNEPQEAFGVTTDEFIKESENEHVPLESEFNFEYKPPVIPREERQQESPQETQKATTQEKSKKQAFRHGMFLSVGTDIAVVDYAGFGRWNGYDPMRFTLGAGFFFKTHIAKRMALGFDAYAMYSPHLYSANTPNIYGKAAGGTHWKTASWEAVNHIVGTGARVSVDIHPSEYLVLSLLAGVETAVPAEKSKERASGRIFFGSYALVMGTACEIGLGNNFALGLEGHYVHVPDYRGSAAVRISLRRHVGTARSSPGGGK